MNYSELVEAIQQGNQKKTTALLHDLMPRLLRFLSIHMNASRQDAEDCAQEALLNTLDAIRKDNIREENRILSFLLTTCRNNYLNMVNKQYEQSYNDYTDQNFQRPRQLTAILDNERRQMLEWCIQHLSDGYRTFIEYWFTHPELGSKAASTHFGISEGNVWTRKHRIIKKLQSCLQEKN